MDVKKKRGSAAAAGGEITLTIYGEEAVLLKKMADEYFKDDNFYERYEEYQQLEPLLAEIREFVTEPYQLSSNDSESSDDNLPF